MLPAPPHEDPDAQYDQREWAPQDQVNQPSGDRIHQTTTLLGDRERYLPYGAGTDQKDGFSVLGSFCIYGRSILQPQPVSRNPCSNRQQREERTRRIRVLTQVDAISASLDLRRGTL